MEISVTSKELKDTGVVVLRSLIFKSEPSRKQMVSEE